MVIDMNYWTKVLKKLVILIISLFGLYLLFKVAVFYLPFLIAFILALILEPAIRFLMRNCKFKRNVSSIIILVLVTGILLGLIAWGIATIISEGSNLLDNLGTYVTQATRFIQDILKDDNLKKFNIPNNVITTIEKSATDLLRNSYILAKFFLKSCVSMDNINSNDGSLLSSNFFSIIFYMYGQSLYNRSNGTSFTRNMGKEII